MVVTQCLEGSQNFLRDFRFFRTVLPSIRISVNNWDKTTLLRNACHTCKHVGVSVDSKLRWAPTILDVKDRAPFAETSALSVVLAASVSQTIDTLRNSFAVSSCRNLTPLSILIPGIIIFLQDSCEVFTIFVFFEQAFFEHDATTNVLT